MELQQLRIKALPAEMVEFKARLMPVVAVEVPVG
jgi:hypothetical protein